MNDTNTVLKPRRKNDTRFIYIQTRRKQKMEHRAQTRAERMILVSSTYRLGENKKTGPLS